MRQRPFKQIDVLTDTAYLGNPLAVVLDGSGLSTDEMQHFAHWTNLSETTFLLPPSSDAAAMGADYRVRIFTPGGELPFAGHPTLGSCHAWLQAGGVPRSSQSIVQECTAGLINIQGHGPQLAFAAPLLKRSAPEAELLAHITSALGLVTDQVVSAQLLNNGPHWLGLLLDSVQTVRQLEPDHVRLKTLGQKVGIAAIEGVKIEVRAFAAPVGVNEDPVTGSFNASLAQWLIADGLAPSSYVATQGTALGRRGQVFISCDDTGQVWVAGHSVTCINGMVNL
jgi:PhzF family phenazine biosynthesis protein